MFILIGVWGGPRRVYATLKFFIYTFFGSVFMLIALLYLYQQAHTFDLATLAALPLTFKEQAWIFFAFLIAFAIKVPMVPVHTWLPRSEEHTSELQSLMRISYAVFCLIKQKKQSKRQR